LTLLDKTKFFCHIPQAIVWDTCPDNGRELQLYAAFDNTQKTVNAAFTEDGIDWCVSVSWAVSSCRRLFIIAFGFRNDCLIDPASGRGITE
jgi:hypothetical protein